MAMGPLQLQAASTIGRALEQKRGSYLSIYLSIYLFIYIYRVLDVFVYLANITAAQGSVQMSQ
jgi:hypothetical protein